MPDERWGKIVCAFVKRTRPVKADDLDAFCRHSGLANFKRPRRYVFVAKIPKSPVGKLLRRKLVAGDYQPAREASMDSITQQKGSGMGSPDVRRQSLAKLDGFRVEIDEALSGPT